jgi:hypothetical protein
MSQLVNFTSFIYTYQPSKSEADLTAWGAKMDVDTYMRSMVMEWLTGNWDAHAYGKLKILEIVACDKQKRSAMTN